MNEQLPVADIPVGFVEYQGNFIEPIFTAWHDKEILKVNRGLTVWKVGTETGVPRLAR